MRHAHHWGWAVKEQYAFADSIVKDRKPLAKVKCVEKVENSVSVEFERTADIIKVELSYTKDSGRRAERKWDSVDVSFADGRATATLVEGTTAYYFNLIDVRGFMVSSEYSEIK